MKLRLLLLALCPLALFGCLSMGTPTTYEGQDYVDLVSVPSTPKKDLYVRANNWMVNVFNNADSVIQFSDKDSGTISGRFLLGRITSGFQGSAPRSAYAVLKIDVKDEAARITITTQSFFYADGNPYTLYTGADVDSDVKKLFASFRDALSQNDDW